VPDDVLPEEVPEELEVLLGRLGGPAGQQPAADALGVRVLGDLILLYSGHSGTPPDLHPAGGMPSGVVC
jgi:hypothetical protein